MRIELPLLPGSRTVTPGSRAPALLSERQLERAMHRERQRSDRCHADLALIRLELTAGTLVSDAWLKNVLESIFQRVRAIDVPGWLAPGVVGILLPETDGEGAWTLVGDLIEGDETGQLRASTIGVYAYPEALPEGLRPVRGERAPRPRARASGTRS